MKTVVIGETFDAYPNGKLRTFTAGEEPEVANDLADLLIGKGLARESAAKKAAPAPADSSKVSDEA